MSPSARGSDSGLLSVSEGSLFLDVLVFTSWAKWRSLSPAWHPGLHDFCMSTRQRWDRHLRQSKAYHRNHAKAGAQTSEGSFQKEALRFQNSLTSEGSNLRLQPRRWDERLASVLPLKPPEE